MICSLEMCLFQCERTVDSNRNPLLNLPSCVVCPQINEALLANFEQCDQKHASDELADSQQTNGTAEEAGSPFRIKRKDGQSKKGALGFKPLLRSSSKPPSSARQEGKPQAAIPGLPDRLGQCTALPAQQPLSPSAYRTPAVTRARHSYTDAAEITSGMLLQLQLATVHSACLSNAVTVRDDMHCKAASAAGGMLRSANWGTCKGCGLANCTQAILRHV